MHRERARVGVSDEVLEPVAVQVSDRDRDGAVAGREGLREAEAAAPVPEVQRDRVREQELRSLRKLNTEYEEQNAILSKHIDNMKSAIEKLEVESAQQKNNNAALGQHLNHLRQTLAKSFAGIAIPGTNETPTLDTVDDYVVRLHAKLTAKDKGAGAAGTKPTPAPCKVHERGSTAPPPTDGLRHAQSPGAKSLTRAAEAILDQC